MKISSWGDWALRARMIKLCGASRKNGLNNAGALRKNGRKKSLIEGGTKGIRGARSAP